MFKLIVVLFAMLALSYAEPEAKAKPTAISPYYGYNYPYNMYGYSGLGKYYGYDKYNDYNIYNPYGHMPYSAGYTGYTGYTGYPGYSGYSGYPYGSGLYGGFRGYW